MDVSINRVRVIDSCDPASRLTAHDVDGTRTEWTFDANGNRTHENGTEIARYDQEDRLTAWRDATYTYTPAGDLQSRTGPSGTTSYTYDALGSLHQVTLPGGTRIDYVIDPQGRRIGKKKNGALQYGLLYQDALNPIAELGPDGRIKSVFLYAEHAHAPAAMVRDGKLYRFVTDHLGSIRVVIDTTTGTIAQQLDYDVWGKVTLDTQPGFQPFGFAGGVYDADTGLTRFGARDYDGETGRWTAKDPILFAGGDTNLYGYVLQDPVNWVDPRGLSGCEAGKNCFAECLDGDPLFKWVAPFSLTPAVNLKISSDLRLPNSSPLTSIDRRLPSWTGAKVNTGATVNRGKIGRTKFLGRYGTFAVAVGTFATAYSGTAMIRCWMECRN